MPTGPGDLDAYEVAVLTGGEQHAVTTAAFQLNHARVLEVGGDPPTLTPAGPLPTGAHPAERAVYQAAGMAGSQAGEALPEAERRRCWRPCTTAWSSVAWFG